MQIGREIVNNLRYANDVTYCYTESVGKKYKNWYRSFID